MQVNAALGAARLDIVGRKKEHWIAFEITAVLITALPFYGIETVIFQTAHMIVQRSLIAGCGADPGVLVHLFLHPAAQRPFIEIF
jgi:hypothetical protein